MGYYKREVTHFAVLGRDKWNRIVITRLTKTKPRLDVGEVAVKVKLNIDPDMFSEFLPVVEADIEAEHLIVSQPSVEIEEQ